MKVLYTVANATPAVVEGTAMIDGHQSTYQTRAFVVELVPESQHNGTVKLTVRGEAQADAEAMFTPGAKVMAVFSAASAEKKE